MPASASDVIRSSSMSKAAVSNLFAICMAIGSSIVPTPTIPTVVSSSTALSVAVSAIESLMLFGPAFSDSSHGVESIRLFVDQVFVT